MIDATTVDHVENKHQAIGVMSTIGFFMVNAISSDMINNELYTDGCISGAGAISKIEERFRSYANSPCCAMGIARERLRDLHAKRDQSNSVEVGAEESGKQHTEPKRNRSNTKESRKSEERGRERVD